ncbi:MAG: CarD family transcriptional regulator, partial [Anaerolineales bacterium]
MPAYRAALERARFDSDASSLGLLRPARLPVAASLAEDLPGPIVILVSKADRWLVWTEELVSWNPGLHLLPFPEPNPLFYDPATWGPRTIRQRLQVLAALTGERDASIRSASGQGPRVVLATARAAMTRTLPPEEFRSYQTTLSQGQLMNLQDQAMSLMGIGYQPSSLVVEPGQMSRRGGILDVWPPAESAPIRIELEGERIETLRGFDPESQRSTEPIESVAITPAREGLPLHWDPRWVAGEAGDPPSPEELARLEFYLPKMRGSTSGLLDYLPKESWVFFDHRSNWEETVLEIEEQAALLRREQVAAGAIEEDFPVPYLSLSELTESLGSLHSLDLGSAGPEERVAEDLGSRFSPGPRFGGQIRKALEMVSARRLEHDRVVVVSRQADRLHELWERDEPEGGPNEPFPDTVLPGDVHILTGALTEGWELDLGMDGRVHLLTDAEIFGWVKPRSRSRPLTAGAAPETAYADFKPGDWVVHVDHGIARFGGLVARKLDDLPREFLQLLYAEGDELFVPIHQADRVMRYLGADSLPPSPSRLGNAEWERAKNYARVAVEEIARELLALYARRQAVTGHAFSQDGNWQRELEASFPYEETEDQLRALEAIKRDMEAPRPMDRLICGDAGYGKTEVALRAAFKAVLDGKQVAVLVPTTVLAQ